MTTTHAGATNKPQKKNRLRYNEYYNTQFVFDELYKQSQEGAKFRNLMPIILSDANIQLAYRTIKRNKGSKTKGTNSTTIIDFAEGSTDGMIQYVRQRLAKYQPQTVRRKEIPKPNGKMRPLGIPTMEDRLIQQCIKQVLEPICEAKFYPYSFGFRPNRGCKDAIAYYSFCINRCSLYHVVDVDIKGFFDNVSHEKLLKQLWTLGIQDKRLICIISKMLKAEVEGVGIPEKGTPQGGILSPLLANVVLNELDWWIHSQWLGFPNKKAHKTKTNKQGHVINTEKFLDLRKHSNLKEVRIVRYADDFKIICASHRDAVKIFEATKKWLKERLNLETSPDKSKIVDLRKNCSEFLGFSFYAEGDGKRKSGKTRYVMKSHMSPKAVEKVKADLKKGIIQLRNNPTSQNALKLNSKILGIHNYYEAATECSTDFVRIAWQLERQLEHAAKASGIIRYKKKENKLWSSEINKHYGNYTGRIYQFGEAKIFPIRDIRHVSPMQFKQGICNYTREGRALIHNNLRNVDFSIVHYLASHPPPSMTEEMQDNRISLFVGQYGRDYVTGNPLGIGDMHVHHKKPKSKGGTDAYANLVWVSEDVHTLIHATKIITISRYFWKLGLDKRSLDKLNKLRVMAGNNPIKRF